MTDPADAPTIDALITKLQTRLENAQAAVVTRTAAVVTAENALNQAKTKQSRLEDLVTQLLAARTEEFG